MLDPWSVVHFASGLVLGMVGVSLPAGLALGVGYEVIEHAAEKHPVGQHIFMTKGPESVPNVAADVAIMAGGLLLGQRWRQS